MLDTLGLGKRAAVQVTDASSIGERIREWATRHVRSSWIFRRAMARPQPPPQSQRTRAGRAVPRRLGARRARRLPRAERLPDRRHHLPPAGLLGRTSLVVPSIRSAAGSGSQRLYSFKDILVLKIVKRLLDTGISLHNIRVAVDHLRQRGVRDLANITLFSDGTTVYECTSAEEVVDLLQGGQGVFGIAVSGAMRELTGAIADFPGERADGGESISAPEDELASRRKHRDRKIG